MKKTVLLLILLLKLHLLFAQTEIYFEEYIEPESDFQPLKQQLKNNPLPQIENAFIKWDYNLIKPFLTKEIRKRYEAFFKINKDSLTRHTWKKRTHFGPMHSVSTAGNFGAVWEFNTLRLESTEKNSQTLLIDYYYQVKDSALIIYSMESSGYPYQHKLRAKSKTWIEVDSIIQTLRVHANQKNTAGITQQLKKIEAMKPTLAKEPNFNEQGYFDNLARHYGNLSWYLILEGKYKDAIAVAEKGLSYDGEQTWIYTNYALSNLLAGNKETAVATYQKYKDQQTNSGQSFKAAFKVDLKEVREAKLIEQKLYDEIISLLDQ